MVISTVVYSDSNNVQITVNYDGQRQLALAINFNRVISVPLINESTNMKTNALTIATKIIQLLISISLVAGVPAALGDSGSQSGVTISPMVGYYNFDRERLIDDSMQYTIGLGYRFNSPWELEFAYLESDSESKEDILTPLLLFPNLPNADVDLR